MDLLNEVPITLVVKAPNQKVADQTVECALNWTVKKLKEHLALVYPSNPTENQQKIIYSGKLLQDDITLEDVLHQHGSTEIIHTVHLVCSNSLTDINTSQSTSDSSVSHNSTTSDGLRNRRPLSSDLRRHEQENHDQHQQQLPQTPSTSDSSVVTDNGAERLNFSASAFQPANYNMFTSSYPPYNALNAMSPPSGQSYTAEQLRWLQQQQQAYAQYMSNYMQFFQQGAFAAGQPFNYAMPPTVAPSAPPANAAQDQPANPQGEPAQPQQPQVVRMNAQGGLANDNDDDEMDRDWLDWFFIGVRFFLLMCVLYFYSTPIRFFSTVILMLFIYWLNCLRDVVEERFQFGWFRVIGQRPQPVQPVQPPVNPPNANAADNPDGTRSVDAGTSEREEPRQPRGLLLALSVFLSFFASLAPQPPPPNNAN